MRQSFFHKALIFLQSQWQICTLCILAFCIRLPWLDLGLPQQYHPDEWVYLTSAFKLFKLEFFNGTQSTNFFYYLVFIGYLFLLPYEFLLGRIRSPRELYEYFYQFGDPFIDYANSHFMIVARLVAVIFTIICGCIGGVWLSKRVPKNIALITVGLFFLLPLEFLYSRFALPDLPLTCAMFLTLICIQKFHHEPSIKNWIVACSLSMVCLGLKLPGAVVFFPLILSLWFNKQKFTKQMLFKYAGIFIITITVGTVIVAPQFVFSNYLTGFIENTAAIQYSGKPAVELYHHDKLNTQWDYLRFIFEDYGIAISVLMITGIALHFKARWRSALLWTSALLFYFVVFQSASIKMARYAIPLTTIMLFSILPYGLLYVFKHPLCKSIYAKVFVCIILFAYPLYKTFGYFSVISKDDTRTMAYKWLEKQDLRTKSFAREIHYTPILPKTYRKPVIEHWYIGVNTISDLKQQGIDIVMISDQMQNGFLSGSHVTRNYKSYYDSLQLLAHFEQNPQPIPSNPTIDIFQVIPRAK